MDRYRRHGVRPREATAEEVKALENKIVNVGQLRGRAEAEGVVRAAARLYRERIVPTLGRRPSAG